MTAGLKLAHRSFGVRAGALAWAALVLAALAAWPGAVPQAAPKNATATVPGFTGKPVGPFGLRYALAGEPSLGQALEVRIMLSPDVALDNVTLTLSGPDALVIDRPLLQVARIEAGARFEAVVTVTPFAPEVLDLRLIVQADVNAIRQTQGTLIPIRLGDPKARAPADLKADPDDPEGARVHSLPGIQTPDRR